MGGTGSGTWIRYGRKRLTDTCLAIDINDYHEKIKFNEAIGVKETRCNFGGHRTWMICPGEKCGRRASKLYKVDGVYLCRKCHRLAYRSQLKSSLSRMASKIKQLRTELGAESEELLSPIISKPEQMKEKTYKRIVGKIMQSEIEILMALCHELRLDKKWGNDWRKKQ